MGATLLSPLATSEALRGPKQLVVVENPENGLPLGGLPGRGRGLGGLRDDGLLPGLDRPKLPDRER